MKVVRLARAAAALSALCVRAIGAQSAASSDREYWYNQHVHEEVLRGRADTIVESDPSTIAAHSGFPDVTHIGAGGVRFEDTATEAAYERYLYVRMVAWVRILDSLRLSEGQQKVLVNIAVTDIADIPDAGRLYRNPYDVYHETIVLRRDQLTPQRIQSAVGFMRSIWTTSGFTPTAYTTVDIPSTPDLRANAGTSLGYGDLLISALQSPRPRTVSLDPTGRVLRGEGGCVRNCVPMTLAMIPRS